MVREGGIRSEVGVFVGVAKVMAALGPRPTEGLKGVAGTGVSRFIGVNRVVAGALLGVANGVVGVSGDIGTSGSAVVCETELACVLALLIGVMVWPNLLQPLLTHFHSAIPLTSMPSNLEFTHTSSRNSSAVVCEIKVECVLALPR